jgi:hypothetical protein
MARPSGGYALVLARRDTSLIELALLDDAGTLLESSLITEEGDPRPLVSAALDPATGAIAILRTIDQLRMELGWFDAEGTPLTAWRVINILEFHTSRLVVSGGKVWLMHLPNFADDSLDARMWSVEPRPGYQLRQLPELRAHAIPVVATEGEIVIHSQGSDVLSEGTYVDGPELVRIGVNGAVLAREEVPAKATLRLATFVGAWDGGLAAVYPGVENGAENLLVVRASADLSTIDPPEDLLPGLPTIVHLASTAEEDRVFYVTEDARALRVRVIPRL